MKKVGIGIGLGLMTLAATASAQPGVEMPAGVTTDRAGTELEVATLDVGIVNFDDAVAYEGGLSFGTRLDFYGQLLGPVGAHRAGFYVAVPYGHVEGFESFNGLGTVELGGIFAAATGTSTDLVLRGGVVPGLDSGPMGNMAPIITGYGRVADLMTGIPGITWLRASSSVLHRRAPYFLRADFGLDVPTDAGMDPIEPFARVNLAAGVHLGSFAVLGELASVTIMSGEVEDNTLSTVALTARGRSGRLSPCVGLVVPVDDELQSFVDLVVVVGLRAGAPD